MPRRVAAAPVEHSAGWAFLDVPERAQFMYRPYSGLNISERREHNHRRHIAAFAQGLQKAGEAVETGHVHASVTITSGMELFQSFSSALRSIGRGLGLHPPCFHHTGETCSLAAFVIDNQYIQGRSLARS